jgi:hypothetical protein
VPAQGDEADPVVRLRRRLTGEPKRAVYRPPEEVPAEALDEKKDAPRRRPETRPRQVAPPRGGEKLTEVQAALRATRAAIDAIAEPQVAAAGTPNFVSFTTDRFTGGTPPDGAELRIPEAPEDRYVSAYFATRNLDPAVKRCTFSWWLVGAEEPLRVTTVMVNPQWLNQVDVADLGDADWLVGMYQVLVHSVAEEPELIAAGAFEIRKPVVFAVSDLAVERSATRLGASCVLDPDETVALTFRFASIAGAGRTVHVTLTGPGDEVVDERDIALQSPPDAADVESFDVKRRWSSGLYTCTLTESGQVLARVELFAKPPPADLPPREDR